MDLVERLVADRQAPELGAPVEGTLDNPAMSPQSLAGLDAVAGGPHTNAPSSQEARTAGDVIRRIGMQRVRSLAPLTTRTQNRWDCIDQVREHDAVMAVGARQADGEWGCPLGSAETRRIGTGRWVPLLAGILALSRQARCHSIWLAAPRSSSSSRWSQSQIPASCQSRSRLQHVIPLPPPSACASISHEMPLWRTTMLPARQARSGTRGRPPLGLGGSRGSSGSIHSQNASETNGCAMIPRFTAQAARAVPWL